MSVDTNRLPINVQIDHRRSYLFIACCVMDDLLLIIHVEGIGKHIRTSRRVYKLLTNKQIIHTKLPGPKRRGRQKNKAEEGRAHEMRCT